MKQDLNANEAVAAAEEEDNQLPPFEILSCSNTAAFHFSLSNAALAIVSIIMEGEIDENICWKFVTRSERD